MTDCKAFVQFDGDFDGTAQCVLRKHHSGDHETFWSLVRGGVTCSSTLRWKSKRGVLARLRNTPARSTINWGTLVEQAREGYFTWSDKRGDHRRELGC